MHNRTFKCAFLILIISTIFLYVYLGVCTKVSLSTNISTSIFNNNIIDYKDNEITIEYSNLNNYLIRVNKYYDLKDTMSLIENNSYNATMTKNDNKYIYTATLSKDVVKKYFNNYYNEKETKIKIYFNKDRYSNLNVLNLYNKINKETITRNKIELILNEFFLIVLLLIK